MMAFLLKDMLDVHTGFRAILVGVVVNGKTYAVPYAIDTTDPLIWIANNEAKIIADASDIGIEIDPALVAALLEDAKDGGAAQAIDAVVDMADLFPSATTRKAIKALILVIMDEFNLLRAEHGLDPRTPVQFRAAFKNKYKSL